MAVLMVPELDEEPWPTLGPQIAEFITERAVFGPGSLQGERARLDDEKLGALYRLYEVYPQGHELEGRRRFRRGALEWRKGLAKTEFAAWITLAELHPEGPVRCDGFDASGNPVGRPVVYPSIPMMAYTEEQVSDLAYGVLKYIVEEGPDADLFDVSLERIIRLSPRGKKDGVAMPVASAPNSRDGALTTFQHFDEPHRLYLPKMREAHETMSANLDKRVLEDPWSFYTSTAGQPGQNSIEEDVRREAEKISEGTISDPRLFFFARWADEKYKDLSTVEKRIEAIADATGPVGEYGPGQFAGIADNWDREGADKAYLERVWLNRWVKSSGQAFDVEKWKALAVEGATIPDGAFVTVGFDGARFRDATAFVVTDIATGVQLSSPWCWEKEDPNDDEWEVPEAEVTAALEDIMARFDVWRLYGDPPHWTETMGSWAARWPDQVEEFWTNQMKRMAYTLREFAEGIDSGSISHNGDEEYTKHIAAAGRKDLRILDDHGQPLWILQKIDMGRKFDRAMAGVLSWKACLDARKSGASPRRKRGMPRRIY